MNDTIRIAVIAIVAIMLAKIVSQKVPAASALGQYL